MKESPKLNLSQSRKLYEEALTLVPGGVLGARKPTDFIDGEYPIFLESGCGTHTQGFASSYLCLQDILKHSRRDCFRTSIAESGYANITPQPS